MADNLFPDGYDTEVVTVADISADNPVGYRNGILFDYSTGDFRRDGMNKMLDSDGIESWKAWCVNCLQTERYKHLAYSPDFGIDMDSVFRAASHDEAESILTREITEALNADPYQRTDYVEGIAFEWTASDAVRVVVTIHGVDDVTIDATAYITKGEG